MSGATFAQGTMAMPTASSAASPGHSSPESFEVEEDPNPIPATQWQMMPGQTSPGTSTPASHTPAPLQKRRRVTRACDECRRKKIKCDGKQPCTHCTVYSYGMALFCDRPSPDPQSHLCHNNRLSTNAPQIVHTISLRIGEGTPHPNTSKLSKPVYNEPSRFSKPSSRTLI
jgi:hypothetical protein